MEIVRFITGKTKKYNNANGEEKRSEALEEIRKFIEEQKSIILRLDKDVSHIELYSSKEWEELNQLTIQMIMDAPEEFEKRINELKMKTLDRNFSSVRKAVEIKAKLQTCLHIQDINSVNEKRSILATIPGHNTNRGLSEKEERKKGKIFGIISVSGFKNLKTLLAQREKLKGMTRLAEVDEYVQKLIALESDSRYEGVLNSLNQTERYIQGMQVNKLNFSQRCEEQIKQILENNPSKNFRCEELQLSLYMMIFSQYFDDKNPLEVSEDDLNRIIKKVWVESAPGQDESEADNVYMSERKYEEFLDIYTSAEDTEEGNKRYRKEATQWILSQIRNAVMHGSFEVFQKEGINMVNVFGEEYRSTFKFDCFIDICEELFKTSPIKGVSTELENLLNALSRADIQNAHDILGANKLELFDLYVNSIVTYNEDLFHKNKDTLFRGISEVQPEMKTDSYISHVRNSVVHRHRRLDGNEIVIRDGRNSSELQEKTRIDFNNFCKFIKEGKLIQTVMQNFGIGSQQVSL